MPYRHSFYPVPSKYHCMCDMRSRIWLGGYPKGIIVY